MLLFILRMYSMPYRLARVFIIHSHLISVFSFELMDTDQPGNRGFYTLASFAPFRIHQIYLDKMIFFHLLITRYV